MNDYELHVQDSDELGPGSDLVISMFAMAMFVVALIGSGFGNEGTNSIPPLDQTKEVKQLRSRGLELEAEQEAFKHRIQQLQAQVSELEAKLPKKIEEDVLVTLLYSTGEKRFSLGSAQISNDDQRYLIDKLRQKASFIQEKGFNTLVVEGYASPEPLPRNYKDKNGQKKHRDANEQLAFDRAYAIAQVLVLAGIPRRCLGLISYGRNRSEILYGPNGFKPNGSEQATEEFDKDFSNKNLVLLEDKLAAERRIEIRPLFDPKSLCKPTELAQQLSAARLP